MKPSNKEPTITITLSQFVQSHLGSSVDTHGNIIMSGCAKDKMPISRDLALIIFTLTKNQSHCYIEFAGSENPHLRHDMLWDLVAWQNSNEIVEKQKLYSHKRRIERWLFDKNVQTVKLGLLRNTPFDEWACEAMAFKCVQRGGVALLMEMAGVTRLFDKESEL